MGQSVRAEFDLHRSQANVSLGGQGTAACLVGWRGVCVGGVNSLLIK